MVIPVFNEEECLDHLVGRLNSLRNTLAALTNVEFLFVDDGSQDQSLSKLLDHAAAMPHVKVIALSRNFGHQLAVTAGIDHATGDFVALIDADLQDPPEVLAPMLEKIQSGFDVVYGQRRSRRGETLFKKASASLFYRMLSRMCEADIPKDTGDFRIMSRRVVDVLREMREKHRFIRGMVPWIGFKSFAYLYDRDERFAGVTKYPLKKMLSFATNAVLSFSTKPLALAMKIGLGIVLLGIAGAVYMLYLKIFTQTPTPGITAILVAIAILSGAQIMLTALVGSYVAKIFEEAKNRPLYIVARTENL